MNKYQYKYLLDINKITSVFLKTCLFILCIQFNTAYSLTGDANEPLEVIADSVVLDEKNGLSTFTGDAIVTQGSLILRANIIELHSSQEKVTRAIAVGSKDDRAYYKQEQDNQQRFVEAHAVTITYSLDKQFIYFSGNADLIQGFNSFSAATLEYDILNDKVIAKKSEQQEGSTEPVQRVKFIINF
jgi:lipopolysaccharide export system protein LptA